MKIIYISLMSFLLLSNCARDIDSSHHTEETVGNIISTTRGTIENARQVTVTGSDSLDENGFGLLVGAATGGVLGNTIGKGSGRTIATLGGALAGAALGSLIESDSKKQSGIEYVIRREDGKLITLVQGSSPVYRKGTPVYIQVSHQGRSRIIPAY